MCTNNGHRILQFCPKSIVRSSLESYLRLYSKDETLAGYFLLLRLSIEDANLRQIPNRHRWPYLTALSNSLTFVNTTRCITAGRVLRGSCIHLGFCRKRANTLTALLAVSSINVIERKRVLEQSCRLAHRRSVCPVDELWQNG